MFQDGLDGKGFFGGDTGLAYDDFIILPGHRGIRSA